MYIFKTFFFNGWLLKNSVENKIVVDNVLPKEQRPDMYFE